MTCALCEQNKPLRFSHIVPEFVYAPLYDHKHRALGIHGRGRLRREVIQNGVSEPLLCDDCEQFLNDRYEKPFKKYWFDQKPLPKWLGPEGIRLENIDYTTFKLFHLSVLFRCGVARDAMFAEVKLGPHESALRHLVRSGDPGRPDQYPIFACCVVDRNNAPVWRLMTRPFKTRFDGHIVYAMLFGGCMWYYTVSRHRSPQMVKISLQPSGSLWIIPERWENIGVVQQVSRVLRGDAL